MFLNDWRGTREKIEVLSSTSLQDITYFPRKYFPNWIKGRLSEYHILGLHRSVKHINERINSKGT